MRDQFPTVQIRQGARKCSGGSLVGEGREGRRLAGWLRVAGSMDRVLQGWHVEQGSPHSPRPCGHKPHHSACTSPHYSDSSGHNGMDSQHPPPATSPHTHNTEAQLFCGTKPLKVSLIRAVFRKKSIICKHSLKILIYEICPML